MILIVEDNPENAELLRLFLERKAGLKSMVTVDGDLVLELCQSGNVDLVIMDIQLNHTFLHGKAATGVDLTRQIKANPDTASIPVLLATAHAMREQKEQFLRESGAEAYLPKPVENYDAFIAEVKRLLKHPRSS